MKAEWIIDEEVLNNIKKVIDKNSNRKFVKERYKKNVKKIGIDLSKNTIWKVLIGCEITTQQKSGPGSFVDKFLKSNNAILTYDKCKSFDKNTIANELSKNSLRNNKRIAEFLTEIIYNLENGEWSILLEKLNNLKKEHNIEDEINVAGYLHSGKFKGLGLKQSRNFLQWLGLTEYEIPIDSRELKVLRKCKCNFVPNSSALGDETTYLFLEKGIQKVCERLNIKPCILDACFFVSFDKEDFSEEMN